MEIKTCEQYVLDRLERAENDVEALKVELTLNAALVDDLKEQIHKLENFIQRRMSIGALDDADKSRYIELDSPWEKYDSEDFEYISAILNTLKEDN